MDQPLTIGAIFVTLTGAVAALWKAMNDRSSKMETRLTLKLDHCEEKHGEVNSTLLTMAQELGELKGRQEGINTLAEQVLSVVASELEKVQTPPPRRTKKTTTDEP